MEPGPPTAAARPSASALGHRHVVRHRLPDGSATDVVGFLERAEHDALELSPRPGERVRVELATVIALRRVPDAPGGPDPRRTPADRLEQITAAGWVAEHERLGDWWLRSGGGFTGRANSVLAVGDPGRPVADAAELAVAYARSHAIAPMAQVVVGSEEEGALLGLGWSETHATTDVLTLRLATLLADREPAAEVEVTEALSPAWLAAFARYRTTDADPTVVRRVLRGERGAVGLAAAGAADGGLGGIGRVHLNAGWAGVSTLWTHPTVRRRGLGTAVLVALGRWSARRGARNVVLQVARANVDAHATYAALGFELHHTYRYLAPPGAARPSREEAVPAS